MQLLSFTPATTYGNKIKNIILCFICCLLIIKGMPLLYKWLFVLQYGDTSMLVPGHVPFQFKYYEFLTNCIQTPIYEEFFHRVFPIEVAFLVGKYFLNNEDTFKAVMLTIIFASMQFGWEHGGVEFVFIQGVGGVFLSLLYIMNGRGWSGYISVMIVHFLINFNSVVINPLLHK